MVLSALRFLKVLKSRILINLKKQLNGPYSSSSQTEPAAVIHHCRAFKVLSFGQFGFVFNF